MLLAAHQPAKGPVVRTARARVESGVAVCCTTTLLTSEESLAACVATRRTLAVTPALGSADSAAAAMRRRLMMMATTAAATSAPPTPPTTPPTMAPVLLLLEPPELEADEGVEAGGAYREGLLAGDGMGLLALELALPASVTVVLSRLMALTPRPSADSTEDSMPLLAARERADLVAVVLDVATLAATVMAVEVDWRRRRKAPLVVDTTLT